jgi:UDP-N-acetylglucosamine--N-acetylmuramyl-(pentapeptide) pyrophosphoryl-undecaprenol N-acetylglucosamine transferase
MRILMAGGGTGGHFYPALAVLEELRRTYKEAKLAYIGTRRGIEGKIMPSYPAIPFYPIHVRGLERHHLLQNMGSFLLLFIALVETFFILIRFRPHVIIGMGGYASFPAVFLGSLLGRFLPMRTVIHEQNVVAGLANRALAPLVDKVLVSYSESKHCFQKAKCVVVTGNPIRKEFLLAKRSETLYQEFGLNPKRQTVLVFGGSHGSTALTTAIHRAIDTIARNEDIQVLLVTGSAEEEERIRGDLIRTGVSNVVVRHYLNRMGDAFALADLIVCRAGATTVAEITSCGKPAVLIPWGAATDGHQWENARYLKKQEACRLAEEKDIAKQNIARLIEPIVNDRDRLSQMASNSLRLGQRRATTVMMGEIVALAREART